MRRTNTIVKGTRLIERPTHTRQNNLLLLTVCACLLAQVLLVVVKLRTGMKWLMSDTKCCSLPFKQVVGIKWPHPFF